MTPTITIGIIGIAMTVVLAIIAGSWRMSSVSSRAEKACNGVEEHKAEHKADIRRIEAKLDQTQGDVSKGNSAMARMEANQANMAENIQRIVAWMDGEITRG